MQLFVSIRPHPTCEIGLFMCSIDFIVFDIDLQCVDDNNDGHHQSSLYECIIVEERDKEQVDARWLECIAKMDSREKKKKKEIEYKTNIYTVTHLYRKKKNYTAANQSE